MKMGKIIIVAPLSALSKRTRLFKLSKFVKSNFEMEISHFAWERVKGEAEEGQIDFSIEKKIIQRGGGYGGSKIKLLYFKWMILVFFSCLKIKKNNVVWALGFESAFPALLASKIKGFKVIFDDADRFSLLFKFPRPIKKVIQFFERFTSKRVFLHVIPGIERYDFKSNKFFILKNMPSLSQIEIAKESFENKLWNENDLVININGWLGSGRGMKTALKLCKEVADYQIKFILVGKLDCDEAMEMSLMNNVKYLGNVSNSEALKSYLSSDFVYTYYNPNTIINCFAESNKWGDAIKTGIGIIVNSEVITANFLRENQAAISFPYYEVDLLKKKLIDFSINKKKLTDIKSSVKKMSENYGYFEDQLMELFKKIK
jgi:hypothetical protein